MDVKMKSRHGPLDIRHIVRDMMKKWIQNICQKVFEVVLFQYSLDSGYMLIGSEFKVVLKSEASSVAPLPSLQEVCEKQGCVCDWVGGGGGEVRLESEFEPSQIRSTNAV